MNLVLLLGLYPLVCMRTFFTLCHQLITNQNQTNNKDQQVDKNKELPQWTSAIFNIAYIFLVSTGLVIFIALYLLKNTVSLTISFALTMEMVCFCNFYYEFCLKIIFLDAATNEGTLILRRNCIKRSFLELRRT